MSTLRLTSISIFTLCCLFLFASFGMASDKFTMITTDELKSKIDAGETLTLVDALSEIEHNEMTIAGSVNIPSSNVEGNANLPADKAKLIIFFCKGPKCTKSREAAEKAIELGYTNVMVYNEGLPAWAKRGFPIEKKVDYPKVKFDRLSPKQVMEESANAVLLDIRGNEVKDVGSIKGAVSIPLDNLSAQYSTLPQGKKIILMDHAGKQANIAGKFLHTKGYTNLAAMDGGVLAWKSAGLPME